MAAFGSGIKGQVRLLATASAIAESCSTTSPRSCASPTNRDIRVDIEERSARDLVRGCARAARRSASAGTRPTSRACSTRPYRSDRLALAVHPAHPLASRKSLRFEQTLDYEHVGLPPSTAVHTMLQRAAASTGRPISYRVIVSNFDAALRVVAANLGISVVPREVGGRPPPGSTCDGSAHRRLGGAQLRDLLSPVRDAAAGGQRLVEHLQLRATNAEAAP